MSTTPNISNIDAYDYDLPRERIAQEPLAVRSDARLMIVNRQDHSIDHAYVRDLPQWLTPDDCLVVNNTRVVPAKLVGFRTETGGRWQGLFLQADAATGVWEVLTKTRGTLRPGETITIQDREGREGMRLVVVTRTDEGHLVVTPTMPKGDHSEPPSEPSQWLERYGRIPLPPYIRDGQMVDSDVEDYQTVYAEHRGSVAAPTAGLHFTEKLLDQIRRSGTEIADVTLHVGIGTFRPIAVEQLDDHVMHSEWGSLDAKTADKINDRRQQGRCVAVGTTSVRVLESAAAANDGKLATWTGSTDLFIKPPFDFKAVDALMTNFHLPRSSLLVMVSAFAGHELIMRAYQEAIAEEYRFFSYGDAMLIL